MHTTHTTFWDNLALRYPRYNDASMCKDIETILNFALKNGVNFASAQVLDIGCGTGTIALPIAQMGAVVTAVDLSASMLDILHQDAESLGVRNAICTQQGTWSELGDTMTPHDFVIVSMTPAVCERTHFEKAFLLAQKGGVYVGWGAYKNNALLDAILDAHTTNNEEFCKKNRGNCIKMAEVMEILKEQGAIYQTERFETSWQESYGYQEALSYVNDHLRHANLIPQPILVEQMLHEMMQDERIVFETKAEKCMIVWKNIGF